MLELSQHAECLGLGTGRTHQNLRGASVPYPKGVANRFLTGRDLSETPDDRRCVQYEEDLQVQLAVKITPDPQWSASGATSSAFDALVFCGIRVVGPWN